MSHFLNRSGRLFLMVGLGLCALLLVDLRQDMLAARGPASPVPLDHSSSATERTVIFDSHPPQIGEGGAGQQSPRPQSLAINTGISAAEPDVVSLESTDIAVNDWQGASFPVENFQAYTSPFGYRMSPTGGYSQEFHYGLDMAAPQGSYIRNWWSGTVVEVSDDSNCGTSVVVESGNWLHIYCHMQGHVESDANGRYLIDRQGGLQIWEGQQVQAGDRIGRVGMTGRTTGPHLHWGLKYDNNWVDPALVLRAMYSGQRNATRPEQPRYQ